MRNIAGIPESALIENYLGKYACNFDELLIRRAYSPSSKKVLEIPYFKYALSPKSFISVSYTNSKKAIYIRVKVIWSFGWDDEWVKTHKKLIPLVSPDGIKQVEDFIERHSNAHKIGHNICCAIQPIWE